MTYSSKTYTDVITLIDKTDNYQADIDSTAGDVLKNGIGSTCLICRLWQNGTEVDPLKSTTYSTAAPSSPAAGAFLLQDHDQHTDHGLDALFRQCLGGCHEQRILQA